MAARIKPEEAIHLFQYIDFVEARYNSYTYDLCAPVFLFYIAIYPSRSSLLLLDLGPLSSYSTYLFLYPNPFRK